MLDKSSALEFSKVILDKSTVHDLHRVFFMSFSFRRSKNILRCFKTIYHSFKMSTMSMVSHRGHNCIFSALMVLDSALTS